jgi:hypothetical protein
MGDKSWTDFAPEYDHNSRKTSKRNRDLRRRTQSFTRFHSSIMTILKT